MPHLRAVLASAAVVLLLALALAAAGARAQTRPPGDRTGYDVMHLGVNRSFTVYTPTTYDPNVPTPLVMTIHFFGGQERLMALFSYMDVVAEQYGFIVAYPRGIDRSFYAGPVCCGGNASRDDVSFIRTVVAEVASLRNIDLRRVYATGQSNGGYMSHRLACDASDIFAAIAPVAGSSPWPVNQFPQLCSPSRPMSILALHGTNDGLVDYEGAVQTLQYWLAIDGCSTNSVVTYRNGVTTCESWTQNCRPQNNGLITNVTLCSSEGASHLYWPHSPLTFNDDIDTSREIWRFFSYYYL